MQGSAYRSWTGFFGLVLILALVFALPTRSAAQTNAIIVAMPGPDSVDIDPWDGLCRDEYGVCSLRAAVMEANARPGPDTIHLMQGTYTLTIPNLLPDGENEALTGDLDVIGDLEIIGGGGNPNADPWSTIIQAGGSPATGIDKVFSFNPYFDTPANNRLAALTIRHGNNRSGQFTGVGRAGNGWGGGLDWDASNGGTLAIDNCAISDNIAGYAGGGGIALWNTHPVAGQTPTAGSVTISRTIIIRNETDIAQGGAGGGIFIGPYLLVSIDGSEISNNFAVSNEGGGIYQAVTSPDLPLTITGTAITGNCACGPNAHGGGAFLGGTAEIINSTISGNLSSSYGGGLALTSEFFGLHTLRNVTIANNHTSTLAASGAGLWIGRTNPAHPLGQAAVFNSLIVGNTNGNTTLDNLSGELLPGSSNNISAGGMEEHLFPLGDNGGFTFTHALPNGSPALDAGDNAQARGTSDQRGRPRFADSSDADRVQTVDIGAYEAHPTIEPIPDQVMPVNGDRFIDFHVGDPALGFAWMSTHVDSANPDLFPMGSVNVAYAMQHDEFLYLTPAADQSGTATITLTYGATSGDQATHTFTVDVRPLADLAITVTAGNADPALPYFYIEQPGVYTFNVTNVGDAPTTGPVSVADTLPPGLSALSMTGEGWTCDLAALTCSRADALAVGESYPPILLTVDVGNVSGLTENHATVTTEHDYYPMNDLARTETWVLGAPFVYQQPQYAFICAEQETVITARSGPVGNSVQWQIRPYDGEWTDATGPSATTEELHYTPTREEISFDARAVFTNPAGSATSSQATFYIRLAPRILEQPEDLMIGLGSSGRMVVPVEARYGLSALWQTAPSPSGPWSDLEQVDYPPNMYANYEFAPIQQSEIGVRYVRAKLSNACGEVTSAPARLTVLHRLLLPLIQH